MDFELALSCWGAGLATILAIIQIRDSLFQVRRILAVDAHTSDIETIKIRVTNIGFRPVTLVSVDIAYGQTFGNCTRIYSQVIEPLKLDESDAYSLEISRNEIIEAAKRYSLKQDYHCRIFVIATTTTRKRFSTILHIPYRIIIGDNLDNARDWIAADLFVGFPQMGSQLRVPFAK